ncbi:MAG TPA: hypothetical protein VLA44_07665 [Clostridia bacterium]|nr:hypothetical protein [Clostridia bacterium]
MSSAEAIPAPPAVARRFPIRLGPRSRLLLRVLFGVRPEDAYVDLGDELVARFGWSSVRTPRTNIASWRIEGPWRWITAIGVRRGLRQGDLTFGGNHLGGVRLDFEVPVQYGPLRLPALYVTVADLDGLAAALAGAGIPGRDARGNATPDSGSASET